VIEYEPFTLGTMVRVDELTRRLPTILQESSTIAELVVSQNSERCTNTTLLLEVLERFVKPSTISIGVAGREIVDDLSPTAIREVTDSKLPRIYRHRYRWWSSLNLHSLNDSSTLELGSEPSNSTLSNGLRKRLIAIQSNKFYHTLHLLRPKSVDIYVQVVGRSLEYRLVSPRTSRYGWYEQDKMTIGVNENSRTVDPRATHNEHAPKVLLRSFLKPLLKPNSVAPNVSYAT
jgi:hypothetical protein